MDEAVQFSCKLEANPALWNTRAGRVDGKSDHAGSINRAIDKINLLINARYQELISSKDDVSAIEMKEAYQGIASSQETLLGLFHEHNDDMKKRIGLNYAHTTWRIYETSLMHLQHFIKEKYRLSDISFKQLNLSFIEKYDYYLRIELQQMRKFLSKNRLRAWRCEKANIQYAAKHRADHRFQSFGEYNALLPCFNIDVKQVRGERFNREYNGVAAKNDKGENVNSNQCCSVRHSDTKGYKS